MGVPVSLRLIGTACCHWLFLILIYVHNLDEGETPFMDYPVADTEHAVVSHLIKSLTYTATNCVDYQHVGSGLCQCGAVQLF